MVNLNFVLSLLPNMQLDFMNTSKLGTFHFNIVPSISTLKQKKTNFVVVSTDPPEQDSY